MGRAHSSKIITMSELRLRWICIDISGVRKSLAPSMGDANFTPSSLILRSAQRKDLETARIGEDGLLPAA